MLIFTILYKIRLLKSSITNWRNPKPGNRSAVRSHKNNHCAIKWGNSNNTSTEPSLRPVRIHICSTYEGTYDASCVRGFTRRNKHAVHDRPLTTAKCGW